MSHRLLVWRGPLDSCNYGCPYCPFAKRLANMENLRRDAAALARFASHVAADPTPVDLLFMPWGEAMIWPWYGRTLGELASLPHVRAVGVQTNGSFPLSAVDGWPPNAGLWISWHPTEVALAPFVAKIHALQERGVPLSVGAVAVPGRLEDLTALRAALPAEVPLWLNALKPRGRYTSDQIAALSAIDPDFPLEIRPVVSRGRACATGDGVWMIDGDGEITRCHLIERRIGNLYDGGPGAAPGPCTRGSCHCFVGYAFLEETGIWRRWQAGFVTRRRPAEDASGA
jgi:hypothetical protein